MSLLLGAFTELPVSLLLGELAVEPLPLFAVRRELVRLREKVESRLKKSKTGMAVESD